MTTPLFKWPGGKRWAAPAIAEIVALHLRGTYFEPFLGGGAVFFHLRPEWAVLSDINEELIGTYVAVQRRPEGVLKRLKALPVTRKDFYRIRASIPSGALNRAARVLYLNRTAFGGIYRLNRAGEFNVPYGGGERTPAILWERGILSAAAASLARVELRHSDFEPMLDLAGAGDVAYCDPTYTVTHDRNGFVRYNEVNFSWSDQKRLAEAANRAVSRGATVLISNAHHAAIRALYPSARGKTLIRKSLVSRDASRRRIVQEYLLQPCKEESHRVPRHRNRGSSR